MTLTEKIDKYILGNILYLLFAFFFLYNALAFGAPILHKVGIIKPAEAIYKLYSKFCHQMPDRSFFLLGEKLVYTKQELFDAGFSNAFEEDPINYQIASRSFYGTDNLGYKIAYCSRDTGIYLMMLAVLVAVTFTKLQFKFMPTFAKLLFVLPMALDGGIQLVSAILYYTGSIDALFYESNVTRRLITGALFGFAMGTLLFPYIKSETAPVKVKGDYL
ncbi:DUF2085 domain-containing protein [Candidatus Dojkabacteria bacterium]|nr:DUF2085 domain-containing protein [Candidatus Dojkabacteria bacterium]